MAGKVVRVVAPGSSLGKLREALGRAKLLAIGVSQYQATQVFGPLRQCDNDAATVMEAFRDHWQLNPAPEYLKLVTSASNHPPTRGTMINEIIAVAGAADPTERVFFYFSGHGHRIGDAFYLVPQDAYSDSDPDALVDFKKVTEILRSSRAKQVVILLDACLSGSKPSGQKLVAAAISNKYLAEYLRNTTGVAVISSSSGDQPSDTKSPNPKLSLFTYYLVQALSGTTEALDEHKFLTIDTLYQYLVTHVERTARSYQKTQRPMSSVEASGTLVIGDYGQSVIAPSTFSPKEFPLTSMLARSSTGFQVESVLTNIRRWHAYSDEYLATRVNDGLGEYLEKRFGSMRARLMNDMTFTVAEVGVDDNQLSFPGGTLTCTYRSEDRKSGRLITEVDLDKDWIQRPDRIRDLMKCLSFEPSEIEFSLSKSIAPESLIGGLKSTGWTLVSVLTHEVKVRGPNGISLVVTDHSLGFHGVSFASLFGIDGDEQNKELTYATLALLGA